MEIPATPATFIFFVSVSLPLSRFISLSVFSHGGQLQVVVAMVAAVEASFGSCGSREKEVGIVRGKGTVPSVAVCSCCLS